MHKCYCLPLWSGDEKWLKKADGWLRREFVLAGDESEATTEFEAAELPPLLETPLLEDVEPVTAATAAANVADKWGWLECKCGPLEPELEVDDGITEEPVTAAIAAANAADDEPADVDDVGDEIETFDPLVELGDEEPVAPWGDSSEYICRAAAAIAETAAECPWWP